MNKSQRIHEESGTAIETAILKLSDGKLKNFGSMLYEKQSGESQDTRLFKLAYALYPELEQLEQMSESLTKERITCLGNFAVIALTEFSINKADSVMLDSEAMKPIVRAELKYRASLRRNAKDDTAEAIESESAAAAETAAAASSDGNDASGCVLS